MLRQDQICFRLSDPKTKGISEWSDWLSEDEPEHPEAVVEQVRVLLVDLGYDPDVVEAPEESPTEEVLSFDELIEVLLRIPEKVPCESMQLVLVSRATGVAQFVTLDENPTFRRDVQMALESASVPLGGDRMDDRRRRPDREQNDLSVGQAGPGRQRGVRPDLRGGREERR